MFLKLSKLFFIENEVDGQAFLELSENDVKTLTPKLGVVKKVLRLKVVYMYNWTKHCALIVQVSAGSHMWLWGWHVRR